MFATAHDLPEMLYDLRREAEMRKARNWVATQFWPQSADDYIKVASAVGTPENAWLRQVTSYWAGCAAAAMSCSRSEARQSAPLYHLKIFPSGEMTAVLSECVIGPPSSL
jgi:hypothetical protein